MKEAGKNITQILAMHITRRSSFHLVFIGSVLFIVFNENILQIQQEQLRYFNFGKKHT